MLNRSTFLRTCMAAAVVAVAATGCGQMRPSEKIDIYEATLSGAQEVPANASKGRGAAEVMFNHNTSKLTWKITYSDVTSPTMGHIHGPAPMGKNAGVVIPFANVITQPIQGEAVLTSAQAADLMAGLWYVNIHSTQFPGGEVRGQLQRRQ
ncbi:CHRD domain-containing protein [Caenimonas koreensis DSM 17982]|uniref:CHRD domain-containing protein n=1 Tax=Caenimonas koreensis DSM 17982 TaxID=1121255 RepID=A0A844B358_9BURK|nr:CHRD domain-containing protein [Caenimonas koreensis]MRD45686.1 CHRD domain-containing protein [Caenimonas koreensis DSM 17982]